MIYLYGTFPYRFFLCRCRLFGLLQNGVLDRAKLTVCASHTLTDQIAVFLQLSDAAADAVDAVLADTANPFMV